MCGRYTMVNLKSFVADLPWASLFGDEEVVPRYNVAPTQPVPIIANREGEYAGRVEMAHWGLIPSWAKDMSIGSKMINARSETLAEKPSFRGALKRRRCIIPVDGFYEWQSPPGAPGGRGAAGKQPMYIRMRDHKPFAFAGLWEFWRDPRNEANEIVSCTVITTEPNELMAAIHNRMPVILPRERYLEWLAPGEQSPEKLSHLLVPMDADLMEAYPVGRGVNNPRNEDPENIVRL